MTTAAPDHDEIVRVVQLYVDGFNGGGVAKFREAFHEDAWIFYTDAEGALHKNVIRNSFEGWAKPAERTITGRIISVTQAGDVASVLLGFDSSEGKASSWVDFHSLLRIDGVWRITNKTATHHSRAGEV
jgi:ketosteroid isomerase-like protein